MGPNKNMSNSNINEELFILTVQEYPNLYDLSNANYHNNLMKENSWEEIGEKLKLPADVCKSKWKCLRESFRKAMHSRRTKSGQAAKSVKPWRLEPQLEFLKPHIFSQSEEQHSNIPPPVEFLASPTTMENETFRSIEDENDTEENNEDTLAAKEDGCQNVASPSAAGISRSSSSTSDQRGERSLPSGSAAEMLRHYMSMKLARADTSSSSSGDHLTKYFQSVEETVRMLPPHFKIRLKCQISQLVHNAEYEYQNFQFQQASPQSHNSQRSYFQHPPQSQPQTSQPQHFQIPSSQEHPQPALPNSTSFYNGNELN